MKIREIHCKRWFIPKSINAITLYPFIFYNKPERFSKSRFKTLQKHEMVHVAQVEKLGWFKFYASYINLNFIKRVKPGTGKYEKEAYKEQHEH